MAYKGLRMPDKSLDTPPIDAEKLAKKAKKDPKSKKWNNANSRRNLRQYQDQKLAVVPEIIGPTHEDEEADVSAIVVGRKLNPDLVRKLMPQRGVLTAAEKKRYVGIVQQYLGDFKNEEPTATDIDDIFEIAKSDIMETRLLHAAKDSPDALVNITQAIERIYKRKQTAKENLSSRRSDRKDSRTSQDINIVDLVVRYDLEQKKRDEDRVAALLAEEEEADIQLKGVLKEDGY
jgi:hypothetical protein